MKKGFRLVSLALVLAMSLGVFAFLPAMAQNVDTEISKENKEMRLWYNSPAPDDDNREWKHINSKNSAWEILALPIGNSYMGAKVFGLTDRERIQISENSLSTSGGTQNSGTTNFTETYLHFNHELANVTDYERDLVLNDATSHVRYTYGGVTYEREYFTSYPDKVMVIKLTASGEGNLDFTLEPKIPYYAFEGKTGDVTVSDIKTEGGASVATLTLEGNLPGSNKSSSEAGYVAGTGTVGYDMDFEAQYRVFVNGGSMSSSFSSTGGSIDSVDEYANATLTVSGADSAYIVIALGTNYEMDPIVYNETNNDKKLDSFPHPHEKVTAMIEAASEKTYEELRARHVEDYTELFSRVAIDLGGEIPTVPTNELLNQYRSGNYNTYVEELLFAFGRYILISSSRDGNLPPNLNGIWNRYHNAICKNGYWGNVNIQMNFWSAFNTDLAECFESYVDLYNAFIERNSANAVNQLKKQGSIASADEAPGLLWALGTGMTPFDAAPTLGGRDGWGNTPYMAELFWDYYDYTRDNSILANVSLPALMSSAAFLSLVMEYDEETGLYLTPNSGSPEQSTTAPFIAYVNNNPGYVPVGTTYDQALAYSNYLHVLEAVDLIGEDNLSDSDRFYLAKIREQVDKLDPIPIGLSGQVKEFREENYYGEIGEPNHRHISHLTSIYPASVISDSTPAWIDAAKVSLDMRGESFPWGWSYVTHILSRARTGDGNTAYKLLNGEIVDMVAYNMCTMGGGNFQVEANLGSPAAIAEMLLQSHNGYIEPLAALPDAWSNGSYSGLIARGNFEVDAKWADGLAEVVKITSRAGGNASVSYPGIAGCQIVDSNGKKVSFKAEGPDLVSFDTEIGETYTVTGFEKQTYPDSPDTLAYSSSGVGQYRLACSEVPGASVYNLYVAVDNASAYTFVESSRDGKFTYSANAGEGNSRKTFAVTAVNLDGRESDRTLCYYNPEELDVDVVANVLDSGDIQVTVNANVSSSEYRLYSADKGKDNYVLIAESEYPIIDGGVYNANKDYYVSIVNFYDSTESEKIFVNKFGASLEHDYNSANIFAGKTFEPGTLASKTHSGVHSGVTINYDYTKLTDGGTHYQRNRFSTLSSDGDAQVFDGIIDLGDAYILNELKIQDFQPTASTAPFMGTGLEIQAYSFGRWTTVLKCESNADIISYRVGTTYLSFDLGGVRAEKLRIYIPKRLGSNSISLNEIECSGVYDANEYNYSESENVLSGTTFVPTADALNEVHIDTSATPADYGYAVITDGGFAPKGSRFSTKSYSKTQHVDATVDLGGIYKLGEFKIYDYGGHYDPALSNPSYLGTRLVIEVYSDGKWVTVVDAMQSEYGSHRVFVSNTQGGAYLSFDLGDVKAEKLRVYIPSNVSGSSISFFEIECSGVKLADKGSTTGSMINMLSTMGMNPGSLATDPHDSTYGYDKLTDGGYVYNKNRFSTKSTAGVDKRFDGITLFGETYDLYELRLFDYLGHASHRDNPGFAGADLLVEVLIDGVWVEYISMTQAEYAEHRVFNSATQGGAYLSFMMEHVVAEGIRVFNSAAYGSNSISYYEIQLWGTKYVPAESSLGDDNILSDSTPGASGTVDASHPLSNLFDGSTTNYVSVEGTDGSYQLTLDFNGIKTLKQLRIFERIPDSNLIGGIKATASDDTTIEVYRDGMWYPVYRNLELSSGMYTDIDMFCIDCEAIRFTFTNTRLFDGESEKRCALIGEIFCTTSSRPVDRTDLLEAYKTLDNYDASAVFGLDAIKDEMLKSLLKLLVDTGANQADVDGYVSTVNAGLAELKLGAPETDAYGDFSTFNLSLEGDIGFNFYGTIPTSTLTEFPNAFVYVQYADGSVEKLLLSSLEREGDRSILQLNLAAAQMTDVVKIRIIYDGYNCGKYVEHSVKSYADIIINDSSYEAQYPNITNLVKAMLNYGAYAQLYFNYNTDNLANADIDSTIPDVSESANVAMSGKATGVSMRSWTVSLDTVLHAKIYFTLDSDSDIRNYRATLTSPDGTSVPLNISDHGSGYVMIIDNIIAGYLSEYYTVVITNVADGTATEVQLSAMCYVSYTLATSENAKLVDLVKALKLYADAAAIYFGNNA